MSTLSPAQTRELKQAVQCAVACERVTRLPAGLTVAQWAVESAWGSHQPGNNCFGIKAYEGCFGTQCLETIEVIGGVRKSVSQEFATFPSLNVCFEEHARLIVAGKPYANAWAQYLRSPDLEKLIAQIALIYATDPNYTDILLRIVAMPDVKQSLAEYEKSS